MSNHSLVQSLFDGNVDIVGDVHGEICAVQKLMTRMGYNRNGSHRTGRRLVFLGDLTDRGPDSIAVVDLVERLVTTGMAQCVLGNHDMNIMLGEQKAENKWFYGNVFTDKQGRIGKQRLAQAEDRDRIRYFFATLPLALERHDLRVVHACWDDKMIDLARASRDTKALFQQHERRISTEVMAEKLDEIDEGLRHQNGNAVKLITSGPEERTETPFESGGKFRHERRVPWWNSYADVEYCVFGHYASPPGNPQGAGRAICIDYGVGKRWEERLDGTGKEGPFRHKLAALRFPEIKIVFDDGEERDLSRP